MAADVGFELDEELYRIEYAARRLATAVRQLRRKLKEPESAPLVTALAARSLFPTPEEQIAAQNWITTDEAAAHFGVSRVAVLKWIHKGRLHGLKRRWVEGKSAYMLIDPSDLWKPSE